MAKLKSAWMVAILLVGFQMESLFAQETTWVTVEGFAPNENVTKTEARKLAIDDARREAVEKVVGVDLLAETMVINYNVSSDVIRAIPHGKVIGIEVLNEDVELIPAKEMGEAPFLAYKVKIRAQVAKEFGRTDAFFRLEAKANRTVYREGDHIEIQVTPSKDCYLTIFNVLEDETVIVLFPNRFNQNNFIKANTQFIFPGDNDRKKGITLEAFLNMDQQKTDEMFHVLALKEPLYFSSAKFKEGIFGIYDGQSALVGDLVKTIVGIPLSHRAEKFIQYRITK